MGNRILLAGGTGFIGKALIDSLVNKGFEVHVLTRKITNKNRVGVRFFYWDVKIKQINLSAFEGVDAIINMTGANIGEKRWSAKRKKELVESRVAALDFLFEVVSRNDFQIDTLISSSAVGYYGMKTLPNLELYENDEVGLDFLGNVCQQWEQAVHQFEKLVNRVVILRKAVVLGENGMYAKMAPLAKIRINPTVGNGTQQLPWISIEDLVELYQFVLGKPELAGVFNAVSSAKDSLGDFAIALARSFDRKLITPKVPGFFVKLLLGELAQMLLEGTAVSNQKIKQAGFQFKDECLSTVLDRLADEK